MRISRHRTPVDGYRRVFSPAVCEHAPMLPPKDGSPRTLDECAGRDRDVRSGTGRTFVRDHRTPGASVGARCPRRRGQHHLPSPRSGWCRDLPTPSCRLRASPGGALVQMCDCPGSHLSVPRRSGSPRGTGGPRWRRSGMGFLDPKERWGREERGVRCRCARSVPGARCRRAVATKLYWQSRGNPPLRGVPRSRVSEGGRLPAGRGRCDSASRSERVWSVPPHRLARLGGTRRRHVRRQRRALRAPPQRRPD